MPIDSFILTVRDQKVILDAELYGTDTGSLNRAVKRNAKRFPSDFVFQLSKGEWQNLNARLASQVCLIVEPPPRPTMANDGVLKSGEVAAGHGGRRTPPSAFTEHGALMAANILNSDEAAQMSVYIIRAFIKQRELLASQADILKKLAQMVAPNWGEVSGERSPKKVPMGVRQAPTMSAFIGEVARSQRASVGYFSLGD